MPLQDTLTRSIDKLFSLKRTTYFLVGILGLGFILRLIAAINMSDSADSMHFVTHAINFISAGRLETYDQSSGLWFALSSILFNIFGATHFVSTLPALFFGTATILAMYLFTKEFFPERIALLAAFLLAIAPFHIKSTAPEMDVMTMFFALSAMFLFVRALHSGHNRNFVFSGIFMGLAIYTKVYPLLLIPSLFLYAGYVSYKKEKKVLTLPQAKNYLIFLLIAFIFTIPALTHNYLLYQDKGFMDLQFTRTFDFNNSKAASYYGFDPIFHEKNDWKGFFFGSSKHIAPDKTPLFLATWRFILQASPLIFFLGIFGLIMSLTLRPYKTKYVPFFAFSILFIWPFLGSIILLAKHFLFLELFIIPFAALTFDAVEKKASTAFKRDSLFLLATIALIIILLFLGTPSKGTFPHYYGKSYVTQMIEYKDASFLPNSLVVADSRIYRGQLNWMFHDFPFLESAQFAEIYNKQDELGGNPIIVDVYYIECVYDDCGWGTIKNQPEFNASIEALGAQFINNSRLLYTISEPDRTRAYYPFIHTERRPQALKVYTLRLTMRQSVIAFARQPKNWFLYYVGYPNPSQEFDAYNTQNAAQAFLDKIAHFLVKLAVVLALLAPFFLVFLCLATLGSSQSSHPASPATQHRAQPTPPAASSPRVEADSLTKLP